VTFAKHGRGNAESRSRLPGLPCVSMTNGRDGHSDVTTMAVSQPAELHYVRVLLEEARVLSRNLARHQRALLESGSARP
jgi:hypothetical protein